MPHDPLEPGHRFGRHTRALRERGLGQTGREPERPEPNREASGDVFHDRPEYGTRQHCSLLVCA